MVLKIKRITMLLEVDGSQFWDNVEFYNTDKGYHKCWAKNPNWGRCFDQLSKSEKQKLRIKKWRKVKVIKGKVDVFKFYPPYLEA